MRYRLKGIEAGYKKESDTIQVRRMAKKLLRENCEKSDFYLENFTVFREKTYRKMIKPTHMIYCCKPIVHTHILKPK